MGLVQSMTKKIDTICLNGYRMIYVFSNVVGFLNKNGQNSKMPHAMQPLLYNHIRLVKHTDISSFSVAVAARDSPEEHVDMLTVRIFTGGIPINS